MKLIMCLISISIAISGCVNSRVIYQPNLNNGHEYSEVIVYRNYMFLGSALLTKLAIDGIPTAEFFGGEYVNIKVNPGEHIITTTNPVNVSVADKIYYKPYEKYYFDATYEKRNETGILPRVKEELALELIKPMKKIE